MPVAEQAVNSVNLVITFALAIIGIQATVQFFKNKWRAHKANKETL